MNTRVELLRVDGTDLDIVNAARVSFNKHRDKLSGKDIDLLYFLARGMSRNEYIHLIDDIIDAAVSGDHDTINILLNEYRNTPTHWAPFAHVGASFRITAPIFVARQLVKHQQGFVWNEVSRRYVDDEPQFIDPIWRVQHPDKKQGSGEDHPAPMWPDIHYETARQSTCNAYKNLLQENVAPEQARAVLPLSTMTTWIWTGSLIGHVRVVKQRTRSDAQQETREVAEQIGEHLKIAFPYAYDALMHY